MKHLSVFCIFLFATISTAVANDLPSRASDSTDCATAEFARGLYDNAAAVTDTSSESDIKQWIYQTFARADILKRVMACPEMTSANADDTIKFSPIEYTFPSGRKIIVNYETQPRVLTQRIELGNKRGLPGEDSPHIGADSDATWTNTDPAWYGILVVQSGTLDNFIGADKNNTISLKYIEKNIDTIYPRGTNTCTSRTALAIDSAMINRAVTETVGIKDDTNDYYVAGDRNLQWISYAEIGLDVVLTVATFGGWTAASGATKAVRASRSFKNLGETLRGLTRIDSVRDYIRAVQKQTKLAEELKTLDKVKDATRYTQATDELNDLNKTIKKLESTDDNVKKYRDASKTYTELNAYRHTLRNVRIANRGNVAVRLWKGMRAARQGNKLIKSANKLGRASSIATRARDWLFDSSLRHAGTLARLGADVSLLSGIIRFAGDMYDYTDSSTGDFTNNIEFKPLGLLSADDIQGQENVVNYGMWLMWLGDSTNANDDDAAYLQAMDFAAKFHQDLELTMEKYNSNACDVDIFVVRPVIRNPSQSDASLYYLIMNDNPWTTSNE